MAIAYPAFNVLSPGSTAAQHSPICRRRTPRSVTPSKVAASLDPERCLRCRYLVGMLQMALSSRNS